MEEILGFLEGSHDGCPCPFHHTQDAAFLAALSTRAAMEAGLLDQTGNHTVAVQRGSEVFSGDKEILATLLLSQHMPGTPRMDLKLPGEEIRCPRKNEMILPDADDPTLTLQEG
jgi:hypothetical protein